MRIWFATIKLFMRIDGRENDIYLEEIYFVQYFEVVGKDLLSVDNVYETMEWQRKKVVEGRCKPSKKFALLPINSKRGIIHIIPADSKNGVQRIHYGKLILG